MPLDSGASEIPAPEAISDVLSDLWQRRLDTLISGIANGDPYYLQIANAADHISAEHQGRFLVELIQNANDQAVRQGLAESCVSIFRTEKLVSVGNGGQPFDQAKVDSITSIFMSDKTADVCVGNKGIGFKAVFHIADSAEVFSARAGSDLSHGCAIAFSMVRRPFENESFLAEIRSLSNALLSRDVLRRRDMEKRFPGDEIVEIVVREAKRAAGFTFPLRLTAKDFRDRVQQLGLSDEVLSATQTLVVLPVNAEGAIAESIDRAIDEISGEGKPGEMPPAASFLFLPGVARVDLVDSVRGFRAELEKTDVYPRELLPGGVVLRRQRTTSRRMTFGVSDGSVNLKMQEWWVAERMVGGLDQQDKEAARREHQELRRAIQALRLPDENWRDVDQVPVAVGLPIPTDQEGVVDTGHPLGATGRFCIGLPTMVRTGVPLWVSAHFHGKIDRTAIDFQNDYNALLLGAAEKLSEILMEKLKTLISRSEQRLVTLSMERQEGELATAFYDDGGLARKSVVLSADGDFIEAGLLRMPRAKDLQVFELLANRVGDIEAYGFRLPDPVLLANARDVLDGLCDDAEVDDKQYLHRPGGLPSFLERSASVNRRVGPVFWEPFLTWVLTRFGSANSEELNEQVILPTGDSDLSQSSSKVFFAPVSAGARPGDDTAPTHAVDDAGDELSAIDENVSSLLRFFDDSAIKVRTGIARDYTSLAQKLGPISGGGLVRRPRQADLINDALIPALWDRRGNTDKALSLLRQALFWMVAMPQKSRQRVSVDRLLVPVGGENDSWTWVEPDRAYFSEGWIDDPIVDLLTRAFGDRPNCQLVPWSLFEEKARRMFGSVERVWWFELLKEIGVWDCPRVIQSERRVEVMKAYSYSRLTVMDGVPCPTPCVEGVWPRYLSDISRRRVQTRTGQDFYLRELAWIDGLEIEAIRPLVVEAMLRRPERYSPYQSAVLSRWGGEDRSNPPNLWVHAIRSEGWNIIPTSHGLHPPAAAWFLPLESRSTKADRFAFLACVKPEFSSARELLSTMGVVSLDEAGIPRLVDALHELASRREQIEPEALRHFSALVHDIYEAIQARLSEQELPESLEQLLDGPVPLLRDERIAAANLRDIELVFIDDDPVRRRFIDGFEERWVIPKRSHQSYNDLIQSLRAVLGADRVLLVSEYAIRIRFTSFEGGILLLDYLRHEFPDRALAAEIALLIVKGGTRATSPHEETFRQAWKRIGRTRVYRGSFDGTYPFQSCYDAQYANGPALLVDSQLRAHEIIREMWQLVGPSYRDIWAAYAQALNEGNAQAFLEDRGVSSADRTEVEAAIGMGFEQILRRYQPVCLALWRRQNALRPMDDFHSEWARQARTAETARTWLGWEGVQSAVEIAVNTDEPAGSLGLVHELGLTVPEWQDARRALGSEPIRFESTMFACQSCKNAIAGHLMAWFAYLVVPRASGHYGATVSLNLADAAAVWVEKIRELAVPDNIAQQPLEVHELIAFVAETAIEIANVVSGKELEALADPLRELSSTPPKDTTSIRLRDEPDKAATIYEVIDEVTRGQQALSAVDSILKIAVALVQKLGENFDVPAVQSQPLVRLLTQGTWANRVSVLASVRYALELGAPRTASRMKDRQAFRDLDDWRTLWQKFEELGEIPRPSAPPIPKPRFEILGTSLTEDEFILSAEQGPGGELVQRLQTCVDSRLDLAGLRKIEREKVIAGARTGGRNSSGSHASRKRPSDAYLRMLGALGEHFVFQQLRVLLKDFDLTNWRSKAKELFGYDRGDDSLGYDFECSDATGELTGSASAKRCLVEVKSTSTDSPDAFEMSTNEWETAIRCHTGAEDAVYAIVRVVNITSHPRLVDILLDPIQLHLDGVLDYSSRDLLVEVGKAIVT